MGKAWPARLVCVLLNTSLSAPVRPLLESILEEATTILTEGGSVPEKIYSSTTEQGSAVSAVKAIAKASEEGQRIYSLTQANMAATLPGLNLAYETEQEIAQALRSGFNVTTHTDTLQFEGWEGAGYLRSDPVTGNGSYKISGAKNGGFFGIDNDISLLALFTEVVNGITEGFRRLITSVLGTFLGGVFDFIDISQACPTFEAAFGAIVTTYISGALTNYLIASFLAGGAGLLVGLILLLVIFLIVSFVTTIIKELIILNCETRDF